MELNPSRIHFKPFLGSSHDNLKQVFIWRTIFIIIEQSKIVTTVTINCQGCNNYFGFSKMVWFLMVLIGNHPNMVWQSWGMLPIPNINQLGCHTQLGYLLKLADTPCTSSRSTIPHPIYIFWVPSILFSHPDFQ